MNLEDAEDRRRALEVECRYCHARPSDPCVRPGDQEPLERAPAHTSRIADAGVIHAPLTTDELRGPRPRRRLAYHPQHPRHPQHRERSRS